MSDEEAELVRMLAEAVPEIVAGSVTVKAVARCRGYRSKLALASNDPSVDAVGVCVGVRGCRITTVINRLQGERIDLIRWNGSPELMIANALQPAGISRVVLDAARHRATVFVEAHELALAVGRRGANRDLASRLCAWAIDIVTEEH